jgi:MHS family alpha-ketoglutarate permease-like MFS transporter
MSESAKSAGAKGAEGLSPRARVGAVMAGSAGNLIEWYDFYVYAFLALYFAPSFFPSGDQTAQLLNVAGIYAAGFLIRPLGGWYFGRLGDRHGRRLAMVASVLLMGGGSLLVAVLPGFDQIGVAAPALLLVARLAQGFSCGGQYGAAATYLSEVATPGRRGFFASFQFVTLIGGQLLALLMLGAIQLFLSEADIRAWAWRMPFALGAVLAATIILLRDRMHETIGESDRPAEAGTLKGVARHPRSLLIVASLSAAGAVSLYTFTTYMQKFLVNTAGLQVTAVSRIMLAALLVYLVLQPVIGSLSDRIGRRACLLVFTGGMTLGAVPILWALSHVGSGTSAFLLVALALLIISFYTSISGLFKAELFPSHVRALGVGLAHSVSAALFGGSAEYFALLAKQAGHEFWFFFYVAAICFVGFLTALMMGEPKQSGWMDSPRT